jgi:predicted house-cleaning noncanonical NTP pyrophosphatase (MazG superfamily)
MLITETERCPALYDSSLKEYSNKVLLEKLWEEVCEMIISECSQLAGPEKC